MSVRKPLFWSALRHWGTRLGSVLVFIILARILPPEQIGLFSAALAIVAVAEIFAENGLGDAVVQTERLDDDLLAAALTFNVIAGAAIGLLIGAGAPLIESSLGTPGLAPILGVTALTVVINAFSYVPQSLLRRHGQFQWLAKRALVATSFGGVLGIVLAFLDFGAWAMVAQLICFATVNAILIWYLRPMPLRFASPAKARTLIAFGAKVFAGRLLYYVTTRSVELFIVWFYGPVALALYIMGSRIAAVLMQLISAVILDVALPTFSRLAKERSRVVNSFLSSVETTAAVASPLFILLAGVAPEVTRIAFGANGEGSGALLAPVALAASLQMLQQLSGSLLMATGKPQVALYDLMFRASAIAAAFYMFRSESVATFILWLCGVQGLLVVTSLLIGSYAVGYPLSQVARRTLPYLLAGAAAFALMTWLGHTLGTDVNVFVRLLTLGAAGVSIYVATVTITNYRGALRVYQAIRRS